MEKDRGCVCICVNYGGFFLWASSLLFASEIQCMDIVNLNLMCHQNNVYDFQCMLLYSDHHSFETHNLK
jgi:hypothetical protein